MKRLFDTDPVLGLTRYFHYDEATDEMSLTVEQDVTPVIESATRMRNSLTSLDRWGDGAVVAQVPLSIYYQWMREGKDRDDAFLRRWLNDPDNKKFRVKEGRV